MFNAAISGRGNPRYLSTDHDPLFEFHRWQANLMIWEIDAVKTMRHTPVSHPFVERLNGTMRREFLDHVLFWNPRELARELLDQIPFWNAIDLERMLLDFQSYYSLNRVHASLCGIACGYQKPNPVRLVSVDLAIADDQLGGARDDQLQVAR